MDAGMDLDRLVAEKVMGWHLKTNESGARGWAAERQGAILTDLANWQGWVAPLTPEFSTDIAAAWMVVERITRIPQTEQEAVRASNTRFAYWWKSADIWAYSASDAAHMICNAALQALEG